jgi:hypothetical protein
MSTFLDFDDLYTKNALVLGISATCFTTDDGKLLDFTKVTMFSELTGDKALGGTGTDMRWGPSSNAEALKASGKSFPAQVELKIRKGARALGKEQEEIVEFKYICPVKVVAITESSNKKAAS